MSNGEGRSNTAGIAVRGGDADRHEAPRRDVDPPIVVSAQRVLDRVADRRLVPAALLDGALTRSRRRPRAGSRRVPSSVHTASPVVFAVLSTDALEQFLDEEEQILLVEVTGIDRGEHHRRCRRQVAAGGRR